jgi:hypothetical protein
MSNQLMGIAGVFIVTILLIAFLHVFLRWGQPSRRTALRPPSSTRAKKDMTVDDPWLLRSPDGETPQGRVGGFQREAPTPRDSGSRARPSIHSVK